MRVNRGLVPEAWGITGQTIVGGQNGSVDVDAVIGEQERY